MRRIALTRWDCWPRISRPSRLPRHSTLSGRLATRGIAHKRWDRLPRTQRRPNTPLFSLHLWTSLQDFLATRRFRRYPHPYIFQQLLVALTDLNASAMPLMTLPNGILDGLMQAVT